MASTPEVKGLPELAEGYVWYIGPENPYWPDMDIQLMILKRTDEILYTDTDEHPFRSFRKIQWVKEEHTPKPFSLFHIRTRAEKAPYKWRAYKMVAGLEIVSKRPTQSDISKLATLVVKEFRINQQKKSNKAYTRGLFGTYPPKTMGDIEA